MKLGKIDFCKIKKITAIEIFVVILVLIAFGVYYSPNFMLNLEKKNAAKIKSDNAIFTARVLEEFAQNKNAKASDVGKKVLEDLNKTTINPYNRRKPAFTLDAICVGCSSVGFDDTNQMIVVTSYNNKKELVARTVIKPPSFVEYSKFDNKK